MSSKKIDKGKLYNKLHQLQKLVTRFLKLGKDQEVKGLEIKEKHLLDKIKGKHGKKEG